MTPYTLALSWTDRVIAGLKEELARLDSVTPVSPQNAIARDYARIVVCRRLNAYRVVRRTQGRMRAYL